MKQIADYPPILTVEQAAELLQYEKPRVYELIRKKIIPTFPPDSQRGKRILKDQLIEIMRGTVNGNF